MEAPAILGLGLFIDLFTARTDAYVRNSREHVNEAVTVPLLIDAYTKGYSVSGYTANGETTRVGAIDFDHCDDEQIAKVKDTLAKVGFHYIVSQSRRGQHVWVSFVEGVPSGMVNRALTHAIRLADPEILKGAEVFPKISGSPWGVGALRMPLMTHPKDGKRYPVYAENSDKPITKIVDVVAAFFGLDTPRDVIERLSREAPVEYPRNLGEYRRTVRATTEAQPASALLQGIGATNAQPGRSIRCPFHDDSHASMSIADDDERVWCKAAECDAYNGGRGIGSLALAKMVERVKA